MGCCASLTPQTSKLEATGDPSTLFAFPTPLSCLEVVLALLCMSLSRMGQGPLHVLGEQRLVWASGVLVPLGACCEGSDG